MATKELFSGAGEKRRELKQQMGFTGSVSRCVKRGRGRGGRGGEPHGHNLPSSSGGQSSHCAVSRHGA